MGMEGSGVFHKTIGSAKPYKEAVRGEGLSVTYTGMQVMHIKPFVSVCARSVQALLIVCRRLAAPDTWYGGVLPEMHALQATSDGFAVPVIPGMKWRCCMGTRPKKKLIILLLHWCPWVRLNVCCWAHGRGTGADSHTCGVVVQFRASPKCICTLVLSAVVVSWCSAVMLS